jgi:hypothetical protein
MTIQFSLVYAKLPRRVSGSRPRQRLKDQQEDTLLRSHPARRRLIAVLGVLAVAIALPALGASLGQARSAHAAQGATGATGSTVATDDPNNYTCFGHIEKGVAESGVTGTQVEYQFSCDGPITGYQLETEPHQVQYFDQSPLVALNGVPSITDSFSCSAFVPGVQINCAGQPRRRIRGDHRAVRDRRQEPLHRASAGSDPDRHRRDRDGDARRHQDRSHRQRHGHAVHLGPYDLGRPWGCKGDSYGADTRLGNNPPKIVLTGPPTARRRVTLAKRPLPRPGAGERRSRRSSRRTLARSGGRAGAPLAVPRRFDVPPRFARRSPGHRACTARRPTRRVGRARRRGGASASPGR